MWSEAKDLKANSEISPYCTTRTGPNDGFEWEYKAKSFTLAKRGICSYPENLGHVLTIVDEDEDEDEDDVPTLTLHVPHPADFHPLHKRREFLLDNGQRVIVASRDAEES
jgi:hypothetical protein